LDALCKNARVVISTVGPYILYGEPLVKACIENNTHYVDLTGEPEFVDTLIHKYHEQAQKKKIKIVNSCGFDSIPYDLGALYTVNQLKTLFDDSDNQLNIEMEGFVRSSGTFSGGTFHSAITAFSRIPHYMQKKKQWREEKKQNKQSNKIHAKRSAMPRISYRKELNTWVCPFPSIDPQVVNRSAKIRDDYAQSFNYKHYIQVKKLPRLVAGLVAAASVVGLSQLKPTRNLLLKIKSPGDGPSLEERNKAWFKVTMHAKAKGEKLYSHISGGDPGYGETSKMLAESALCLAFDHKQLPNHYGVVTPASAMGETLIERLQTAGIEFAVDYQSKESIVT